MTAAIAKIRAEYAGALSARGLSSVPPFVKAAQEALSELETAIATTAARVPAVMSDIRIYPQGRRQSAREALGVLDQAVADKAALAQRALELARTQLRAAALRPVDRKEELTARADAQMLLDRVDPKRRDVVMGELAKRQDAVGALVSSQAARSIRGLNSPDIRWLGDEQVCIEIGRRDRPTLAVGHQSVSFVEDPQQHRHRVAVDPIGHGQAGGSKDVLRERLRKIVVLQALTGITG